MILKLSEPYSHIALILSNSCKFWVNSNFFVRHFHPPQFRLIFSPPYYFTVGRVFSIPKIFQQPKVFSMVYQSLFIYGKISYFIGINFRDVAIFLAFADKMRFSQKVYTREITCSVALAKVYTCKISERHHSRKFIPAKVYTNKVVFVNLVQFFLMCLTPHKCSYFA